MINHLRSLASDGGSTVLKCLNELDALSVAAE